MAIVLGQPGGAATPPAQAVADRQAAQAMATTLRFIVILIVISPFEVDV
jgi:hypothetical protein